MSTLTEDPIASTNPLQTGMETLYLGKQDESDPEGTHCVLFPDEATALWQHITDLRSAAELAVTELETVEREMQGIAPEAVSKSLPLLRAATSGLDLAITRGAEVRELRSEIERLQIENRALRNLANNLRPGPISEALGGVEHEKPYRDAVDETCPSCGKKHNRQCDDGWHI